MSTALNITDAYMESLYKLSDEEKISLATRLLNSLKGTFKNAVKTENGKVTSFLDLKGVLSKDIDEEKFYDEYIEENEDFGYIETEFGRIYIHSYDVFYIKDGNVHEFYLITSERTFYDLFNMDDIE